MTASAFTHTATGTSIEPFDLDGYLARFNPDALARSPGYRRAVSRVDPLTFALLYLPHHLRSDETGGQITFSEFHLDLAEQAKLWIIPDERVGAELVIHGRDLRCSGW